MISEKPQFIIPPGINLKQLQIKLQKTLGLSKASFRVMEHIYYDSFDWLIYLNGAVLERIVCGTESRLQLRSLNSSTVHASEYVKETPKFAWDLSAGHLKTRLGNILGVRALFPGIRVRSRTHTLSLLDKEDKTIMRLAIEQYALHNPERSKASQLGIRLQLLPVRGYGKPVKKTIRLLTKEMDLLPATEDIMLAALAAESREPACYTSKLRLHLEPDMRTDAAARIILLHLLNMIQVNEKGTINNIDTEFLHDFRVAIRKTRSMLTQIKGIFPERVLNQYRAGFSWLGAVTSPTRDIDVYLLKFDKYKLSLPASIQDDLDPLHDFLKTHQKKEQAILARTLRSTRYKNMMERWNTILNAPLPVRSSLPNAMRPISAVANKRIMRIYRRVLKEGSAITPESPAESLHNLRKSCKKLRYLIEFFQSLYPLKKIMVMISELKLLQDNLGDFQDYEVQATHLEDFSHQMVQESEVTTETLMAMQVLVERLHARQHMVREEFVTKFNRFSRKENQDKLHRLFTLQHGEKKKRRSKKHQC